MNRKGPRLRRRWRLPISAVLVFGLSALMLAAVAGVLYQAVWAGQASIFELTRDKAEIVVTMVEDRLRQRLDPALDVGRFLADVVARRRIDPVRDARWAELAGGALAATPQLTSIDFVSRERRHVRVSRSSETGYRRVVEPRLAANLHAAFAELATATQPSWGDIAWNEQIRQPVLSLGVPVRAGNEFLGVLFVVLSVADLSSALGEMHEEFRATAFILIDRDKVLVHPSLVLGFPGRGADKPLPGVGEVNDDFLATIWSDSSASERRRSDEILGGRGHVVQHGEDTYVYVYREIDSYGPRPWLIGTYIYEVTFGAAMERLWQAILVGIVVLIVAVTAAYFLGNWITAKLRELAAAAVSVRDLDFGRAAHVKSSRLRELDDAANAFNAMLDGLRWFESYVPRALVRRLVRLGEEREVDSIQRDLTVMFTDIAGFTTLSERMTAPEVAEFLNDHFALIGGCVDAEDGTVDKYLGDGVLAFWGAPDMQNDHAARAARAALKMRDVIQADNKRRQRLGLAPVRLRVGIHTGPVTVGNIGAKSRVSYTIVGDTVNAAERLCELGKRVGAEPAEVTILISSATLASAGGNFVTALTGQHALRGRHAQIEVFHLVGRRAAKDFASEAAMG